MALDLNAVALGLAAAVNDAELSYNGQAITATDWVPDAVNPPHFAVAEFALEPHQAFGQIGTALDAVTVTCRFFTGIGDDRDGQRLARSALQTTGAGSILAAIEAARGAPGEAALGGAASDLVVRPSRGPRLYEVGDAHYYGIDISVWVVG